MIGLNITIEQQPDGKVLVDLVPYIKAETPNEKDALALFTRQTQRANNGVYRRLVEMCADVEVDPAK